MRKGTWFSTGFWDDPIRDALRSLGGDALWVYLHLVHGPNAEVSGVLRVSIGQIAEDTGFEVEQVRTAIDALVKIGWCDFEPPVLWIRGCGNIGELFDSRHQEHDMQTSIAKKPRDDGSTPAATSGLDHLDLLEAEALFILREVAAECRNPVLLFSGGKDSAVLLHLAWKAWHPERLGCPLLHIDTGHNYPEVIAYRDRMTQDYGAVLHARNVEDSIRRGTVRLRDPLESRNASQSVTLMEAIAEFGFDACLGGARRDEEKARAKERVFSVRDEFGQWEPKAQRPELWSLYNTGVAPGEHLRVFPISNWTELDVWRYLQRERIPLPELYFAHFREVVRRGDVLAPVTELTPARPGETVERVLCRFRTVGDISCTAPVESSASSLDAIIAETAECRITERGATRMDDRAAEAAMENRKKEGYF